MAPIGQKWKQLPQLMHRGDITLAALEISIAKTGHTEEHPAQKVQSFWFMVYIA
jgi:hypothetical protein